jgi:hypothetical protein
MLEVALRLTPQDCVAFWLHGHKSRSVLAANLRTLVPVGLVLLPASFLVLGIGLLLPEQVGSPSISGISRLVDLAACIWLTLGIGALLAVTNRVGPGRLIPLLTRQAREGGLFDEHRLALSPEGVTLTTAKGVTTSFWNSVLRVEATDDYLFIYRNATSAFLVPKRDCASEEEFAEFVRAARSYHQTAGGSA